MNYTFSRSAIIFTLVFSLSGCFDIADIPKLNSSWKVTDSTQINDDQFGFVTDSSSTCPTFLTNTNNDMADIQLPTEFGIAGWNIYKQDNDNWRAELTNLIEKNDLIVLQEAKLSFLLHQLMQQYELTWTQVEAFSVYKQSMGVLTASKVMPLSVCKQTLAEPWLRFPKSSLISYYPWAGSDEPLLVANMHMINFTLGVDEFNQQLEGVISVIRKYSGPVIMAGDFNTWTNKRLNQLLDITASVDLQQLVYQNDVRETAFGHPLDDIYFRGMQQISASSYETEASDHNPIVARFGPLY
ncbi:endonuclease/exonuclease/phosphatase family protein [Moritella sp. 24]|uniref:endonuclease/exonuclease/phosphatase family protein n=1 Tax=Moritella sp. 24 TaxID=2746230 RepID=UPI001BA4C819|nr:endonuclease/exonuclease/phosphatase family protein [Moritella sp. 24]QUM75369.1 endonuclease/exonuclease/phosphatase family protein [Moritella sp. 24]